MMPQAVFNRYYRALNPGQKGAVDAIDGPVFVIAGPGTGKTLILTLRIANILRLTDTPPDAILALAFTKSAVHSMRERLVEIIGSDGYRVVINTFHGFCNDIIQRYPEEFPRIIGSKNISGVEQVKLLEAVIEQSRLKMLKPFGDPFYYLYDALSEIERLKKENITPPEFKKLIADWRREFAALPDKYHEKGVHLGKMKGKFVKLEKGLVKYEELTALYQAYEKALRAGRLYDFADMIMEVVRVLESKPDFLLQLQEEYHYLLADEHQDANQAQNRLLELLASFHPSPNLFIVGDEKQAIFQFQGASLENFNYFKKLYPDARLVALTGNYRSSQTILDAAHSLMEKSSLLSLERHIRLQASPRAPGGKKLLVCPFNAAEDELRFVAQELKENLKAGAAARELAVLYRDNQDGPALVPYLVEEGIPYVVESESNILEDLTIQKLLLLFKAIYHFGEDEWLAPALQLDFLRLSGLDVYKLLAAAQNQRKSLYDLLASPRRLPNLGLSQPQKFRRLYENLEHWHRLGENESLIRFFGAVVERSGLLSSVLDRPEALATSARLRAFYSEIKNLVLHNLNYRLADLLSYLETFEKHGLVLREAVDPYGEGVRLMTVHKAKGLEFEYVYIINAYDGHFGNRRRRPTFRLPLRNAPLLEEDAVDSERRLFYVALTRAKTQVVISYAKEDREGRVRLPSQFITEIRDDLKEIADPRDFVVRSGASVIKFVSETKPRRLPFAEKVYLNNLFLAHGLSVTDLNNYLECPLKYFFLNLLRVVRVQTRPQLYGTAGHAALKDFFDRYRQGKKASRNYLLRQFKYYLERQPLTTTDFETMLEKGNVALGGYYDFYRNSWPKKIINEFVVRGLFLAPETRLDSARQVKIKGRIDKIEFLGAGREVNAVDYKTSQPKRRDDYKRQLVFYKLLLDRWPTKDYELVSGALDFIEPDKKGRYKKEVLEITREDTEELSELVEKTAHEILALSFFRRGCGKADCRWCRLFEMSGRKS